MSELIKHIEAINAKALEWQNAEPGRWASQYTTDEAYWNEDGIFTPEDFDRAMLINSISDVSKAADGCRARLDWDSYTLDELQEVYEGYCKRAAEQYEFEKELEKASASAFEKNIARLMNGVVVSNASDEEKRQIVIRWMIEGEIESGDITGDDLMYGAQHLVYHWNLPYNLYENEFAEVLKKYSDNFVKLTKAA